MRVRTHHINIGVIIAVLVAGVAVAVFHNSVAPKPKATPPAQVTPAAPKPTPTPAPVVAPKPDLFSPVKDFKSRVTKKTFGLYITPQNSPVHPERFTGYHLGDDAEYVDVTADVPVYAIADGQVVAAQIVSGYGGVMLIHHQIKGVTHTVLYGHLRATSMLPAGAAVARGQQIAVLGTGYSAETDGERRHLHFSILSDDRIDYKGYATAKSQLSGWIDPLSFTYE